MLAADDIVRCWTPSRASRPDEAENRIEQWCAIGSDDVGDGWCRAELGDIRDESSTGLLQVRCGGIGSGIA